MNTIYTADGSDKEEILALYKTMLYGPADWNEYYPNEDTIEFDLPRNALFVMKNDNGHIIAAISVERESQKGIVIGKGGSTLKEVSTQARIDLERLFDAKVFLRAFVKVREGWSDDEKALNALGYKDLL